MSYITKSDLENKKVIVSGIQDTGKTYLACALAKMFRCAVYTQNKDDLNRYWTEPNMLILNSRDFIKDFEFWCGQIKRMALQKLIDCVVFDDADILFKNFMDTSPHLRDIWANHRHYGLTIIMISHRLQDIPARLYGQTEILILFTIDNPQTIDILNKFYSGLGDLVRSIPFQSHKFVVKKIGLPPSEMMMIG